MVSRPDLKNRPKLDVRIYDPNLDLTQSSNGSVRELGIEIRPELSTGSDLVR